MPETKIDVHHVRTIRIPESVDVELRQDAKAMKKDVEALIVELLLAQVMRNV